MFATLFLDFFLLTTVAVVLASARPSIAGAFTVQGNNPAFQCNQVSTRGGAWQNVIIEAKINTWENEDDDTYRSEDCENVPLDRCDMTAAGFIDTDTPTAQWAPPNSFITMLQEWDGNDVRPNNAKYRPGDRHYSYTLCRSVSQLTLATIRVALDDLDFGGTTDKVNDMNCYWAPTNVGNNAQATPWETINCCTRYMREMDSTVRHQLLVDVRAYYDDGSGQQCPPSGRIN